MKEGVWLINKGKKSLKGGESNEKDKNGGGVKEKQRHEMNEETDAEKSRRDDDGG